MELKRPALIILIFLMLFLCIGSVSALENQTDDSGENEIIGISESPELLTGDKGTYSDLRDELSSGGYINLNKSYYLYTSGDGNNTIEIKKQCIINGNGAVIDMKGSTIQAFNISTSGVIITNLTIKNVNYVGDGGAVAWHGDNGSISDCYFENNAVYKNGSESVYGGAVVWYGANGILNHCHFFNNTAESYGGALSWNAVNGCINNTIFESNYANTVGALYLNYATNTTISGCVFDKNQGSSTSGAIEVARSPNVVLRNSNFTDNVAESNNGGAVFWRLSDNYVINYCNFYNNTAKINGGAFYSTSSKRGLISYCNFTENNAGYSGGALNWNGEYSNLTNCIFTDNNANETSGSIDVLNPNGRISNCTFVGSYGTVSYGFINWAGSNGLIENCVFINASVEKSGGAFCIASSENVTVNNCNFINISGKWGGAIRWDYGKDGRVINCNFTNITAYDLGGAVYWRSAKNGEVSSCTFIDCNSYNSGGSVYWREGDYGVLDNCTFINSYADGIGGAIAWGGENGKITNCYFTNTSNIYKYGNVINWGSSIGEIKNCTMENSNTTYSVYIDGVYPIDGIIYFEKNYFDCSIYMNDGKVLSPTYLIILFNETVLNNGTPINLSSQLYDDKDNEIIFNKKLKYIISNGNEVETSKGNWMVEYSFDRSGIYYIGGKLSNLENLTILNATIDVKIPAEINVINETINLDVNDEVAICATLTPPDAGNLNYNSSDEDVVIVVEGMIIAVGEGNATITVSLDSDGRYVAENKTIDITVSLKDASVSVNNTTLDLLIDDTFYLIAITDPKELSINFTSSDNSVATVDENGILAAVGEGTAIITVSVGDGVVYVENSTTVSVTVSKVPTEIIIDNKTFELKVNDEIVSGANLNPTDAGNVTYTVSNSSVVKVEDSKIIAIGEGTATITVSFVGDNKYASAEDKTIDVTVSLKEASIIAEPSSLELIVSEDGNIYVTTNPEDLDYTFTSCDESVVTVQNKNRVGKVLAVGEGNATITVTINEKAYIKNSTTVTVTVKSKENATISIDAPAITEGENATVTVTLPEDATGSVTIGDEIIPVQNGTASAVLTSLPVGTTTIPVTYSGDDKYNPAEASVDITVNKNATITVTAQNLTKYYKDPQKFTVKVTDAKGQAAANKTVNITINGVTYKRTTDENGTASLNINLNSGIYPVSVAVDDVKVNYTVTVKPTIDASDVIKVFRNDTQYNAIFTDSNGTPLPNIKVSFNIHGIIYNRTTDENGAAKLNINLDAGDYILTAFNSFTGEMVSNMIKVISLVESNDLTKYYRNDSQFVVRIHTADGGYVGAGEEVTFNINGILYTRTTNETGHAMLNINLGQGNYIITTYYKNCSKGNNIEVLPILSAENLSMKYIDESQFKAKLLDGQGKAYAGQSVQFNINGMLYNKTTDSEGIAKLNIRLMAGEYIITSSYNGFNIANTIKITI